MAGTQGFDHLRIPWWLWGGVLYDRVEWMDEWQMLDLEGGEVF
jgi:hypothetical protein